MVAAMSKNLRIPEGFSPATRLERYDSRMDAPVFL
jgi:hypothetical protein